MEKSEYEQRFEPQSLLSLTKTTAALLDPNEALEFAQSFMAPGDLGLKAVDKKAELNQIRSSIQRLKIFIYAMAILNLCCLGYSMFVE